ncbi:hypothetical protein CMO88_01255 [Candidatus Woesearchaeota archaeon]|nr:hypothetical protein [Candidatus Woesearchaeota archaeon]|tara:strand:- start:4938 stop:5519 length:582 start_codon:yes stop_codon:yes gene_type:complete
MKLLVFSDIHNDDKALKALEKKAKKADFLVCAGDFTYFEDGMRKVLRKLNSFGKKVLLVHGNHEGASNVATMTKKMKNISFIHKKMRREGDYAFVGHGGEGFALDSKDFDKFAAKLKFNKGEKVVLITHQPPHKTKLDFIWANHGNKSYRKFIVKKKPILAVCGHLHETQGLKDKIGKCLLINPGPKGVIVEI